MQFIIDGDVYKVTRITGGQHNLLGIRISSDDRQIKITPLSIKEGDVVRVVGDDVLAQVKSGLALVNQELSKPYFVSEVQFLPSDTYSTDVYQLLTIELVRRIEAEGEFVHV